MLKLSTENDSSGCSVDMAEGSAEEEQSSSAAPASPPADLRTQNTHLSTSPPYHHRRLQPRQLPYRQHPNMLATAPPPRHSHTSLLTHHIKTESDMDGPCDVPLNLKSEVSVKASRFNLQMTCSLNKAIVLRHV
uniref:Uncharacterized protein n=1 Tax=Bracon brevicornis TaxID=1563983 RepID=A0A6V7J7I2_9HYME